jgi:alkylhydroperoxidase family enzyme
MNPAILLGLALAATTARGGDGTDAPRPTPLTRPEMKQFLEDMKARKPRIPLPELTAEEKQKLGERGSGYESRLRSVYMPYADNSRGSGSGAGGRNPAGGGFGPGREQDPNMTFDYAFKTELFWIVSRANNCQYCLGHQESKLLNAGLTEDRIAALDGDWSEFDPAERAAFSLARRLTHEPHRLSDADIDEARKYYKDLQILEMVLSVAGNNSINRWKEGVGVPQSAGGGGNIGRRAEPGAAPQPERIHSYLTATSDVYKDKVTKVAAVTLDEAGRPTKRTISVRPPLEPREEVESALAACAAREPRLPVPNDAEARAVVSQNWPEGPLPQWVRLLANFPRDGVARINTIRSAEEKGDLDPLLKARVAWIVARQDRAWYATGLAKRRLRELGQSDDEIYKLDGDWSGFPPAERALFTVARKLAASPVILTDDDVAQAVDLAGPRDVVQLISYTTNRAAFDRITEAAALTLER